MTDDRSLPIASPTFDRCLTASRHARDRLRYVFRQAILRRLPQKYKLLWLSVDMTSSFKPPNLASLADIDAGVEYDDRCVTIQGVISGSSQGARIREDAGFNVHIFIMAAWRQTEKAIVKRNLTVLRPIPPAHDWQGEFRPYSIRRMSVLLSKDKARAVFSESLDAAAPDEELLAVSDRLQEPLVIQTKRFGELYFEDSIGWFEGETKWNGTTVDLRIPADDDGSIGTALDTAEALWSKRKSWKKRIDDYAVEKLLDLKNNAWLADGESPLTAEEFISRMKLTSITIMSDGKFEFWHDDGDMFLGHSIQISGDVRTGPTDADIPG